MKWMSLLLALMTVSSMAFAEENLVGTKIVFEHKGQRRMAGIGTKTQVKGDERRVVVSWREQVKNGSMSEYTAKVNLNDPKISLEIPNYKTTLQGKSVEVKSGDKILGKDNNIYEVVAFFANGEMAIRPVENKYGKLRTQHNAVIKNTDFISSIETQCLERICKGAYVRNDNPSLLCMHQKVGYYKANGLVENHKLVEECNIINKTQGVDVLAVFLDGSIATSFHPIRNILQAPAAADAPAEVEQ